MMTATHYGAWVRCLKPNPHASLRMFSFPYSGGSASSFRTWERSLPMDIEFCSIQMPGRENRLREPAFTQLTPLLEALEKELLPLLKLPFVFYGHSLGAMISFELARHLRRRGQPVPHHLFVSSHRAPQLPQPHKPIHQLSNAAFTEELRKYNGTPDSILNNAELMRLLLPMIRADFTLYETYVYTDDTPLDCPISAFGGTQDWKVSREELSRWREQTRSTFSLRILPGDHFFIHSQQPALLQAVSQDLVTLLHQLH